MLVLVDMELVPLIGLLPSPPPGGVSYLLCSLIKNREEDDQFWG